MTAPEPANVRDPAGAVYCTLFAENYLPQGLTMIESLREQGCEAEMFVLCMDAEAYEVLTALALSGVEPIAFDEVNDPELRVACADRNLAETCWTCTPVVCDAAFKRRPAARLVAYVDADVMFFDDPLRLEEELGEGSVLIFEHGYSPGYSYQAETMGKFNVEVVLFRNDGSGRSCLEDWRRKCIDWCYHRTEPGRMGDQKYLDEWPDRFSGVHVAGPALVAPAPWNFGSHEFGLDEGGRLTTVRGRVLFIHFSKLVTLWRGKYILCRGYEVPLLLERLAYREYTRRLNRQWQNIWRIAPHFTAGLVRPALAVWIEKTGRWWWARIASVVRRLGGALGYRRRPGGG